MHKLTTFMNIAYGTEYHHTGTAHFFNDSECFDEFYALVLDASKDVVDLGFNIGLQAELVMRHTRGLVFGFEASKQIYEHACERFKGNQQIRLYNQAVSNTSGTAEFFDTAFWGAGSLKYTSGMVSCAVGDRYEKTMVELVRLDDVLRDENNIGVIKLDIEGAELLALEGARELLARNRPFMVMEYCHNALAFEFRGAPITGETLFHFANELGYKVYNIYGICLSNPKVWKTSILNDTADVFLIPEEQHARWVEHLLPVYQYRVYDKILDRIEWSAPLHLALGALPSRIYDFINNTDTDAHPEYFASLRARLASVGASRQDVIGHAQLSERAKLLLLLLLAGERDDAIRLARLHTLNEDELAEFRRLAGFSAAHPSGRAKRPYYVAAPDYVRSSAGTRAMYLLCHHLNSIGEDAYIYSRTTAPGLDTPRLTDEVKKRHFAAGLTPIAVYPEIVHGNPLAAPSVARYVLNHPGLIGGPKEFPASDAVYFYNGEYARSLSDRPKKLLQLPLVDESVFYPPENSTAQMRQGILVYPGRFAEAAERHPELFRNATVITQDWPETQDALADLMRRSELLYCFSNSAIIQESLLCDCPVVVMPSPLTTKLLEIYQREPQRCRPPGMALDTCPAEIERARQSIVEFRKLHHATEAAFQDQLRQFVADTQDLPVDRSIFANSVITTNACRTAPSDESYHHWMRARAIQAADGAIFAEIIARRWSVTPRIHLLLRVAPEDSSRLADTLESLNYQLYGNWQVDIVATFPAPGEAFHTIPGVGWHEIGSMDEAADALNLLVTLRRCDWILEIPVGAVLDPMCLIRIAHQANLDPEGRIKAWYFDDDRIDAEQIRRNPRFKPDFDPDWLLCADLLGPLCVRAQTWSEIGGAATDATRPWYDLALRLDEAAGNGCGIGHIAEPLLSLPERLTQDGHSAICAAAVQRALARRGIEGKVGTTSATTWRVDRSLRTPPSVTIAVPSRDKPEYLEACVHHLLASTHYPDYEILIVDGASQEADTQACLTRLLAGTGVPLRSVTLEGAFHLARFANAAAQAAHGEFLVLLADDVRAIQPDWLSRLVGHAARPGVACAGAVLVTPPEGAIDHAGYLPGLGGFIDSPHRGRRFSDEPGYLDLLRVDRTVAGVSSACLALRTADLIAAGGMDESLEMATCAELDFCLRLARQQGRRCVVASGVQLARLGGSCLAPQDADPVGASERHTAELRAQQSTLDRWTDDFASSRFWSLHLDRRGVDARIETSLVPGWHILPDTTPRILAFPVRSAQGDIRVVQPLTAARKAARAQACVYSPTLDAPEPPTVADLARHAPDVVLTHQWLGDPQLRIIRQMRSFLKQTFRVYELDDLVTDMPQRSSLRLGVPADARSHLARMLREFDRLVVSTDYLAERYGHLAREVRVVPNRLEGERWLKLPTQRCTSPRPRVGWAGGTAHEGDLQILADVIAATAHEIDWVFMGMCPDNLRPFLKEFHPFGPIADYPARLAALNLDLAVAPLEQIPFNRAKSNLRLLEYGVLGIPVICTDIDPYRDSPACRVPNEARAWLEALRARIHDPDAAAQEGQAMRDWVTRGFLLEDHVDAWLTAHLPD